MKGLARPKLFLLLILLFSSFFYLASVLWQLPVPGRLTEEELNPVSTLILDRNGKLIYEIFAEKRRTPIKLSQLPPYVVQATVAIEDKDFYKHAGFSLSGITRASLNILTGRSLQGGSTITQQLVKTTLLTPQRTLKRKIRELTLALIVEAIYPKEQILEMYLNNVPYGGTAWGIEAASQTYFNKKAESLNLAEAALLAGLPAAPTKFSPFGVNPELAKERQKAVLRRMAEDQYISVYQAEVAAGEGLFFSRPKGVRAPHFALWVKEQLVAEFGLHKVERGGLRVTTTLDLDLQEFAQETVRVEVAKLKRENVGNGAALLTIPQTGEVLAMVGSKDYFAEDEDGKVNVTLRPRQPGSAIKPINYALGLRDGKLTASTTLADVPSCFDVPGQELYCPVNYDAAFHGAVQARFALGNSYNIPAVRVLSLNGLEQTVEFARKMGISSLTEPKNYGLSFTLGGGEVTMSDMTTAFGVFANQGLKKELVSILKVSNWKGNIIDKESYLATKQPSDKASEDGEGNRAIPEEVAFLISHILLDNNARSAAFGESSFLNVRGHPEVSVKTGTTNDKRDNWTIGYTPHVVVATWVGNNNNEPMSAVASGVTGASPIWNRLIKEALDRIEGGKIAPFGQELKKTEHSFPQKPEGVVGADVCIDTGQLAEETGCPTRFEYFLAEFLPTPPEDPLVQPVSVFRDTGMLASPEAQPEQVETLEKVILKDPLETMVCLNCPTPSWETTVKVLK